MEIRQQLVHLGERLELRQAGHAGLVLGDDLAEHAGRVHARRPGQVDGRLGVTGPLQHAAGAVTEGEDVARAVQIGRPGVGVDQGRNGGGAVGRPRFRSWCRAGVHAHGEGRPLRPRCWSSP